MRRLHPFLAHRPSTPWSLRKRPAGGHCQTVGHGPAILRTLLVGNGYAVGSGRLHPRANRTWPSDPHLSAPKRRRGMERRKLPCLSRLDHLPPWGGNGPWFLCPARGCGRRVAILYGGAIFACRRCHRLAYPSQRETEDDLTARRAERIRNKLESKPGILNSNGWKPKGMHWKTYSKLTAQHDAFLQLSFAGMAARLNLQGGRRVVTVE